MNFLESELIEIRDKGLLRSLRSVHSFQGPEIEIEGRRVLNFCSNDYLGLASDPRLVEAAVEAARRYGFGSGAARLISGNGALHEELETGLARFKGAEAALLFNSGYHANVGVIPALAGEGDTIFSDEFNHASLIDGCRLSQARKVIYRHNDLNHLEGLLRCRGGSRTAPTKKIIVTEAVFSMEGDLCPLHDLLALAERYGATVYLDEAHAVGVFGEEGEGLASSGDRHPSSDRHPSNGLICMGTLGKAFGSYGAFVAGSRFLRDFLINRARSFIFTTALPPAVVGASLAALKIIQEEPERRQRLWKNALKVQANLSTGPRDRSSLKISRLNGCLAPIFSLHVGDPKRTMEISEHLFEEGIYVQGIRPPSVPEGTSRLRITVMATHTKEHLQRLSECLKNI